MENRNFIINGIPIAKARPRLGRTKAFNAQSNLQQAVKWQIKALMGKLNTIEYKVPIEVRLRFYMPIPQNINRTQRNAILDGLSYHVSKPDIDNLEKWILDCGNGILWEDDSQIYRLESEKLFSMTPRTEIEIIVRIS